MNNCDRCVSRESAAGSRPEEVQGQKAAGVSVDEFGSLEARLEWHGARSTKFEPVLDAQESEVRHHGHQQFAQEHEGDENAQRKLDNKLSATCGECQLALL